MTSSASNQARSGGNPRCPPAVGLHRYLLSRVASSRELHRGKQPERIGEALVGEVVADTPTFGGGGDEPALAQAGEVVREIGSGREQLLGQLRRVAGPVKETDQDPLSGRVRQRGTDAPQRPEIDDIRYSYCCTI